MIREGIELKKSMLQLMAFVFLFIFTYKMVQNPFTDEYIQVMKSKDTPHDRLYEEITQKAQKYEIPPQNAKVDTVWKLIPGYNGLKVDINASYQHMKKTGVFQRNKLVYTQVPPTVHLNDLKPAPIYRGNPEKPMVSLLINVAWGNEYIPSMLETLKKQHVKATFFLEGRWVKNNPEMAKMIVDAGHEVGNHSYTHPNMAVLTAAKIKEQLESTNQIIESTTGQKVKWFAPPSGSYRDEVVTIAATLKLHTIMWSVDTIDWQKPSPDVLLNRVMGKVHPGAMVLMHPTESTAGALDRLITQIKAKGYTLGNVSTLLNEERVMKDQ